MSGRAYFALFANSTLSIGFLFIRFSGLGDCHGHVIVKFIGARISCRQWGESGFRHGVVEAAQRTYDG